MPDGSTSQTTPRNRLAHRLTLLILAACLLTILATASIAARVLSSNAPGSDPIPASALWLLLVGSGAGTASTLLALRESRRIARSLERVIRAIDCVASDQPDAPIAELDGESGLRELAQAVHAMRMRLRGEHDTLLRSHESLRSSNRELRLANEVLSQLSITDGLTRLHNHRFFQDHLTREIKRASRSGLPLSMLLIDIDDFKALNDRLGHAAGDEVLVRISRLLESRVRDGDLLARYGGEEFVVLCSGTDLAGAYQLAEALRIQVAESNLQGDPQLAGARVSVSIGVAQYRGDRKQFFAAADRALYGAKAQGKNCVVSDGDT
jgi:diguanylate cyclase (GGDEF)-like protein